LVPAPCPPVRGARARGRDLSARVTRTLSRVRLSTLPTDRRPGLWPAGTIIAAGIGCAVIHAARRNPVGSQGPTTTVTVTGHRPPSQLPGDRRASQYSKLSRDTAERPWADAEGAWSESGTCAHGVTVTGRLLGYLPAGPGRRPDRHSPPAQALIK
jgi:hypothetical protein